MRQAVGHELHMREEDYGECCHWRSLLLPYVELIRMHFTITNHPAGARPAGECTCDRATEENQKVVGDACACGMRSAGEHYRGILTAANTDPWQRKLHLREGRRWRTSARRG